MTDSTVEKMSITGRLDQAVLLTTGGLFDRPSRHRSGDVGPLTQVGGLSMFLRAVLTLQRAGIEEVLVLADDQEQALRASLREDPRVTLRVRWMPVREFPPDDYRTWEALGMKVSGACLVVGGCTLFSPGLVEQLGAWARDGEPALVVRPVFDEDSDGGHTNPAVTVRDDRAVALHERPACAEPAAEAHSGILADVLLLSGRHLRTARTAGRSAPAPLRAIVERALSAGTVRTVTVSSGADHWYREVRNAPSVRSAERALLHFLNGELDGVVDTYFNRLVSRPLTLLFLKMGLSPNAITAVSILVGLLAAVSFAVGSYAAGIIGALLFQLSAIVDCCDGEVARLTFTESELGARLDILGDNAVHMAIFGGMAWGQYLTHAPGDGAWVPLALGAAAILGNLLSVIIVRRAAARRRRGARSTPGQAAGTNFLLKHVANRDFSVAVLIFALLGMLEWFLWLTAVGSHVFWIAGAWLTRPSSSLPRG